MGCVSKFVGAALVVSSVVLANAKPVPASLYDHAEPVCLPELMKLSGGETVSTREDWENKRRPEILKFATENIYGGFCRQERGDVKTPLATRTRE